MTAKEYLSQHREIKNTIKIKEADRKRYEKSALHNKVVTDQINAYKIELTEVEEEITESILRVKNLKYREILHGLYLEDKKIGTLAHEMHYEYNYMCHMHSKALKEFTRVNKDKLED